MIYKVISNFTSGIGHNGKFGYIPDPPEPEESECTDEYVEGMCECCDHFEQCKEAWRGDVE